MSRTVEEPPSPRSDQAGAIAVVTALLLTVLLMFAAFVIDLGALRADRSLGQSVSDMAAAAAVKGYDPGVPGAAEQACLQAVAYAAENLGGTATAVTACGAAFPATETCSSAWGSATYVVATPPPRSMEYEVTVTIPVADLSNLMRFADYGIDGTPCDRVGVSVTSERDFLLAPAGGSGLRSGQTTTSAVGKSDLSGDEGLYASLIVLHRSACIALEGFGSAGAGIEVNGLTLDEGTVDEEYYPGVITVDSVNNGCTNPRQIIQTGGSNAEVYAADHIYSNQLRRNPGSEAIAYSGQVLTDRPPNLPEPGPEVTRAPVDHLFNCRSDYPTDKLWSPNHPGSVSDAGPCDEAGEIPPYITELVDEYEDYTATNLPTGWGLIDDCNGLDGEFGPGFNNGGVNEEAYWFLDCSGPQGFRPGDASFRGVKAIVSKDTVNASGTLFEVIGDVNEGAVLFIQNGDFATGSNTSYTDLQDVFVYVHSGVLDSFSAVDWSAPIDLPDAGCDAYNSDFFDDAVTTGAPPASCFSPMALWTNSGDGHRLGGSGAVVAEGSFIAMNAGAPTSPPLQTFTLRGGSGSDYTRSQFFVGKLSAGGGGRVVMAPNPGNTIEIDLPGSTLIR